MVLEGTTGITLNSFHTLARDFGRVQSEPFFGDYGHSFTIPWIMPHTVGFWNDGTIPTEKKLITRDDPEFFATNNIVPATGGQPVIDLADKVFKFDRNDFKFDVPGGLELSNPQKHRQNIEEEDERAFKKLL